MHCIYFSKSKQSWINLKTQNLDNRKKKKKLYNHLLVKGKKSNIVIITQLNGMW